MKFMSAFTVALIGAAAFANTFDLNSGPGLMNESFSHHFSSLPMEGKIKNSTKGWSGPYWASYLGGITYRWNAPVKRGFRLDSPSQAEVSKMGLEQLMKLAPSEKYDLLLGDYDYGFTHDAANSANPRAKEWAGICHGWAPASLRHEEPAPIVVTNPDGIKIPFGSGDIKALLSFYYAFEYDEEDTGQIGLKCQLPGFLSAFARGCGGDLNPGSLHVVMANLLGIQKEGFLMDRDPGHEVWNQPVTGFKAKKVWERSVRGGTEVGIHADLYYTDESDASWNLVYGTSEQKTATMELKYTLELNHEGEITGGSWSKDSDYPDFIWNKGKAPSFDGVYSKIQTLIKD